MVAPVGISPTGVDETVRDLREADQQDMLLIKAALPKPRQDPADSKALQRSEKDIDREEEGDHPRTEVIQIERLSKSEEQ